MTSNEKYKIQTENRLTTLESCFGDIKDDIIEIKDNHLAHLSAAVKELSEAVENQKITLARWGGAIVILTMVAQFVISELVK